jgi:hypothetical protein
MKKTARNPGKQLGRPRSASRSELTLSQIARADALSRRTARRIAHILDTHIPVEDVIRARDKANAILAQQFAPVAAELAPIVAAQSDPAIVFQTVDSAVRSVLNHVADLYKAEAGRPGPLGLVDLTLVRPRRLRPSRSLAAARARSARLHVQWLDLTARVVREQR